MDIKFINFGLIFIFLLIFEVDRSFWYLNLNLNRDLTGFDWQGPSGSLWLVRVLCRVDLLTVRGQWSDLALGWRSNGSEGLTRGQKGAHRRWGGDGGRRLVDDAERQAEVPGVRGGEHGTQNFTGRRMATSRPSLASGNGGGRWTEKLRAAACFGWQQCARITAQGSKREVSGDAQEHGEFRGEDLELRRDRTLPESEEHGGGQLLLRRAISADWWLDWVG